MKISAPIIRFALLLLTLVLSIPRLWTQTVWTGGEDGRWGNSANWTEGVPNSNAASARFGNGAANGTVTVDGTFTVQSLEFVGNGKTPFHLTGGTLVYDRKGETACGFLDSSKGDNRVDSTLEIRNSGSAGSSSLIGKNAFPGKLSLEGEIITATKTVFDVRKGGNLVISGSLTGAEDPNPGQFNQNFQASADGVISIEGPGVSSNPAGGTVCLILGSESSSGTMNLNRPSSLAGGIILFVNPAITGTTSSLNLGADHAIANDEGKFRTQVTTAGQSVVLQTNGHDLDLGNKNLQLFPSGSSEAVFTLDLGDGDSEICFAASHMEKWRGSLAIVHFTKGKDSVRFGTDDSALTPGQLEKISINGSKGVGIDSQGFLVLP